MLRKTLEIFFFIRPMLMYSRDTSSICHKSSINNTHALAVNSFSVLHSKHVHPCPNIYVWAKLWRNHTCYIIRHDFINFKYCMCEYLECLLQDTRILFRGFPIYLWLMTKGGRNPKPSTICECYRQTRIYVGTQWMENTCKVSSYLRLSIHKYLWTIPKCQRVDISDQMSGTILFCAS